MGVLLVLLAATLGARLVASMDDRVPVYVAARDLVAGDPVDESALTRVDVRLDDGVAPYLSARAELGPDQYVLRDIRAGELVPRGSVGPGTDLEVQLVTVNVDAVSATTLKGGSLVDVFLSDVAAGSEHGAKPTARRALEGVGVSAVLGASGSFGSAATTSVQLFVPRAKVQDLIEAVDGGAKVTLVPVPGTEAGARS
ncbi:MAG: hypothetical protein L0H79_07430 [Intrasporangium sp.]|uniref:hypothetical protein n=1 Tax=Intrasporangium sp. TaxID=1925024 RepID=UPI0026490E4F|nr:hypothetical protein [Intrasporangium sp.]MDN5795570.1 hypothetical protein [Intrasporangium sp.]